MPAFYIRRQRHNASRTPCYVAGTCGPLISHLSTECECTASQFKSPCITHLYPPHNNSSVHLKTTTYVRRSGRITDGMRSGGTMQPDSALLSPTLAPTLLSLYFTTCFKPQFLQKPIQHNRLGPT